MICPTYFLNEQNFFYAGLEVNKMDLSVMAPTTDDLLSGIASALYVDKYTNSNQPTTTM